MKNSIGCCFQCPDRHEGCHSHCEKYLEQRKKWEAEKEHYHREKNKVKMFDDYDAKMHIAAKRRCGRK